MDHAMKRNGEKTQPEKKKNTHKTNRSKSKNFCLNTNMSSAFIYKKKKKEEIFNIPTPGGEQGCQ